MADTFLNEERIGLLIWQISNIWQSKLRKLLKYQNLSLNEYLIIETIFRLKSPSNSLSQNKIALNSCLDVSVVSINLSILEKKNLILRDFQDKRTKKIILTKKGISLITSIKNNITDEEIIFFKKLGSESFNFTNSLKLLLGKKIRIKANKKK